MPGQPFKIDHEPSGPLSVEKTAKKYGVSKAAVHEIRTFVEHFLSPRTRAARRRSLKAGYGGKSTARGWKSSNSGALKIRQVKGKSAKTRQTGVRKK